MYTVNSAYMVGKEEMIGSIEVGKKADLILLDRNIFEIPIEELLDVNVLASMIMVVLSPAEAQEEAIDASDPTKIYTYAGGGVKYTDYTNGDSMWELRATGNIGVPANDMLLFELGYGWHSGDAANGTRDENDITNGRLR